VTISVAVEGITDEAVARRLILHVGAQPGTVYGKEGKQRLRTRITGFNCAAQHTPWLVLVDLDDDADCAPTLRANWLPALAPRMSFRVAVREVEAWLLADFEAMADFLGVASNKVPRDPERLAAPKEAMVNLARHSRRNAIREDLVPREGSGRAVGPAYASRLIEFASTHWRPQKAARRADSLRRAIACLQRLVEAEALSQSMQAAGGAGRSGR
jgi:hypothetical protein